MTSAEKFAEAGRFEASQRSAEAARIYQQLAEAPECREAALTKLAELYLRADELQRASRVMATLVEEHPSSFEHCERLASLFGRLGNFAAAVSLYLRLLEHRPNDALAYYNLAWMYGKQQQPRRAMRAYERALELGISDAHEVMTNMGVLSSEMCRAEQAQRFFKQALELEPEYVPALFNLASQCEEIGDREQAISLYRRILELDPKDWKSLARLGHATRFGDRDDALIEKLRRAAASPHIDPAACEGLNFALGKALDEVGDYPAAFAAYSAANELGRLRGKPYDEREVEDMFARLIDRCSAEWIRTAATALTDRPIFICGMFRSGSTLVEQILGAHRSVTAGGELPFLPWLIGRHLSPYPDKIAHTAVADVEMLAHKYLRRRSELFPDDVNVTDKRPDNHLYLGIAKAMFPAARIVYTIRQPLDNCLSVFFQQFDGRYRYATDLENTAHYLKQQERLLQHWQGCFGDDLFVVNYDDVVRNPESIIRSLLDFLGFDWDEQCLAFNQSGNQVRTASLWQVREGLQKKSSGRWRNYEFAVEGIRSYF